MADYEKRQRAVDNLARRIVEHTGISSEKAREKAAEVARQTDRKGTKNPNRKD